LANKDNTRLASLASYRGRAPSRPWRSRQRAESARVQTGPTPPLSPWAALLALPAWPETRPSCWAPSAASAPSARKPPEPLVRRWCASSAPAKARQCWTSDPASDSLHRAGAAVSRDLRREPGAHRPTGCLAVSKAGESPKVALTIVYCQVKFWLLDGAARKS